MMKMRKILTAMLLVIVLLATLPVAAQEKRVLTLDRAVQINDTQIVLEFSEPIAVNYHGSNTNPWIAIRMGQSCYADVCDECGGHLQWWGGYEYVDSKRDRLLFTMLPNMGIDNINDIRNRAGKLAHHKDLNLWFCIEETPYNADIAYVDNKVCNITTLDGEVYLTPTFSEGYEKCNVALDVDFNYEIDFGKVMDLGGTVIDRTLLVGGETISIEAPIENEDVPTTVVRNNPIIVALMLSGGALLAVILLGIGVLVRKKKKAVQS